jgi:calmodulin
LLGDNILKGSYWQVVDEKWLVRWRRFVSGRGARRYLPPGVITNDVLMCWERPNKSGVMIKKDNPWADVDYDKKQAMRREWRESFNLLDEDLDGTITTTALGNVMRALGRNPTEAELTDLINQVDADGNGTVTFDEFESLMSKMRVIDGEDWDDIAECYKLFDKEGSGVVNFAELTHELENSGEKLTVPEFKSLRLERFVDKDGLFCYEDQIKALKARDENPVRGIINKNSGGTWKQVPKTHLNLVKDYRVVNYNVWNFWIAVHGGGPAITRKGREIYTEVAKSKLQAVIQLQCWARREMAQSKLDKAFLKDFTQSAKGCRETLCNHLVKQVVADGSEQVKAYLKRDNDKRLNKHASFAMSVWKRKKGISTMDRSLAMLKEEQNIFSRSSGKIEEAAEGQPLVVEEHTPVILIGSAEEYETLLTEERGLQFMKLAKLRKHSGCEMTYIFNVPPGFDARVQQVDGVYHNSVLVAVNGYPVNSLTFDQTLERITSTRWPLTLRWRRPINLTECFSLIEIATNIHGDPLPREETEWRKGGLQGEINENQEEQNRLMYEEYSETFKGSSIVKMQILKRRLVRGVTVRLHGSPTMTGGSYLTRLDRCSASHTQCLDLCMCTNY